MVKMQYNFEALRSNKNYTQHLGKPQKAKVRVPVSSRKRKETQHGCNVTIVRCL